MDVLNEVLMSIPNLLILAGFLVGPTLIIFSIHQETWGDIVVFPRSFVFGAFLSIAGVVIVLLQQVFL